MCEECIARMRELLKGPPPAPGRIPASAPTAASLEKHARRFGREQVAETAAELGIEVEVETPTRRARAKGPTLKERVRVYLMAGHGVETIAELEKMTPARARKIIEEVS